jgi:hypothetical protein
MLQMGKVVVLSTLAASAIVLGGAVQFASGHDLASGLPALTSSRGPAGETSSAVNRATKSDRASKADMASSAGEAPTRTVSISLAAFAETSFLVRLPVASFGITGGAKTAPQGSQIISTQNEPRMAKHPIACEPSVSVLTEIAKRLQPGRCVT